MKNNIYQGIAAIFVLALLGVGIYNLPTTKTAEKTNTKVTKEQRIAEAIKDNIRRTKDLKLGYVPTERLAKAIQQTRQMQLEFAQQKTKLSRARFRERGPNNIGGRTRAILIDKKNPNGTTIFAGGVAGGLWKSDDITAFNPRWRKLDAYMENLAIGSIAQDENNPDLMYIGTGEGFPNGDAVSGIGIFRSLDHGENWELLPATNDGRFRATRQLVVHPNGDVYAATTSGLYRSQDQGDNWERLFVAPSASSFYDLEYIETNGYLYASSQANVFRSPTGNSMEWENLSDNPNFLSGINRLEITVFPRDPNIIYAIGNLTGPNGNRSSNVFKTISGGAVWQDMGQVVRGGDFTNGQSWYDLEIVVDPFNPQHVIAGGVPIFRSFDGAASWNSFARNMHVDQHKVVFDQDRPGVVYFGNDGGVYRSTNGSANFVQDRNFGYNVTQFYAGAIHPDAFSDYIIGGTQDNNSLQMNALGITGASVLLGGDGMICHIDQSDPQYQLVSSQFGNYALSTNGGESFIGGGASVNGAFVNPSDYDDDANILYTETRDGDFYRWQIPDGTPELVDITNVDNPAISLVYADPSTPNRVYFGTFGSAEIIQVDNANEGDNVTARTLRVGTSGTVSGIAVRKDDPNHILVTMSNYGLRNNVYESRNGGENWTGVEGNLPDMPVRDCLFGPDNAEQAIIATEAGVWFTERLDGSNTIWIPPFTGRGTPLVRTDMLQLRASDGIILAATHGRGMFTSDVFAEPKLIFAIDEIGYLNAPLAFNGEFSFGADQFLWTFGDGAKDTLGNTTHTYDAVGEYEISFTINDELSETSSVKILPDKGLPYEANSDGYSGGFDNNTEDYGVATISGSAFERGNSSFRGKDGTRSGENAYVVGLNEEFYQPNTHTMLYLPNFDFSDKTLYEFSFWYKSALQRGFDGFIVEYSTDRGQTWEILGKEQDNWYDALVDDNDPAAYAFSQGTPFFGQSRGTFRQAYLDVSSLAGNPDVAFRFVFKSNGVGNHSGIVIDDVEIKKFAGKAETAIVNLQADYVEPSRILVEWTTQPEYFAQRFDLERSFNGKTFERVENKVSATGVLTSRPQSYEIETDGGRDLYFFRVRSTNESNSDNYFLEFTSPVIVVNRNKDEADLEALKIFPNPFVDAIEMTFTGVVEEDMTVQLFDITGRLVYDNVVAVGGIYTKIDVGVLPVGAYVLRYKIGDRAAKTQKLHTYGAQ